MQAHRGYCAILYNGIEAIETNPGLPIHCIDPTLTIKAPHDQSALIYER